MVNIGLAIYDTNTFQFVLCDGSVSCNICMSRVQYVRDGCDLCTYQYFSSFKEIVKILPPVGRSVLNVLNKYPKCM